MQKALTAGAAVILFGAGGCVYYRPAVVSTNSIGTKNEVPVKVVKGYSSASYIFGLGPMGNESLEAAIYDAIKNEKGSSLSNVFVDRRVLCFPFPPLCLYIRRDTMVYGTLVKYLDENGKEIPPASPPEAAGVNDAISPPPDPSASLKVFLGDLKKGTPIRLSLDDLDEPVFEGIFIGTPDGNCVSAKPFGGGFFSGRIFSFKHIKKAELWKSKQAPSAGAAPVGALPRVQVKDGDLELAPPATK